MTPLAERVASALAQVARTLRLVTLLNADQPDPPRWHVQFLNRYSLPWAGMTPKLCTVELIAPHRYLLGGVAFEASREEAEAPRYGRVIRNGEQFGLGHITSCDGEGFPIRAGMHVEFPRIVVYGSGWERTG